MHKGSIRKIDFLNEPVSSTIFYYIIIHHPRCKREAAGKCRRYGIQHMDGIMVSFHNEIHDQLPGLLVEQLGTNPRFPPFGEAFHIDFVNQLLRQTGKIAPFVFFYLLQGDVPEIK